MSLSSKGSFLLVSCLLATTMLAATSAKPTIYKRNQDNVFEPGEAFAFTLGCCSRPQFAESFLMVPVSSTVIPLSVYKTEYGLGFISKDKKQSSFKPEDGVKLITIKKSHE
ncbi:uncharacterized protein LOC122530922 [Frieseomelitta varia]|uniref:uncharacterized protein LOC122530922 n=1 Tax=Frieseomelitta varia TaxID=561572 RepID=UPI001CB68622|nr:uncharacterized protein LOC122530922 [Frieseomelitta varia]